MGARPLRRAIDEYLLAPLAATMVEHRYPAGDQFLFVRSDGNAIQVEFVDPDADMPAPVAGATPQQTGDRAAQLARTILGASGSEAELSALLAADGEVAARLASPEWCALKDALGAKIADPAIWQSSDRTRIFSRYEMIDRVLEARRTAERLRERLAQSRRQPGKISRDLAERLALQLHLVGLGVDDVLADSPIDALLSVEPLAGTARNEAGDAWGATLLAMYRGWAHLRHMRLVEIAAPGADAPPILVITGFGALRVLSDETGLHVSEDGNGRRAAARVRVVAGPPAPGGNRPPLTYAALAERLAATGDDNAVARRYREDPDRLVRDARKGWRSGRLDAVLAGNFDLIGLLSEQP
jgi:ATP-dependent Clp protease ATP-binding subunit ClpC